MTVRNLARGNRRRAAVGGRLDHDVPATDPAVRQTDARLDLDAALSELPDRYRVPVVLCHLQGLSRGEAAAVLGCPEGTLSATLAEALRRLRGQLGARDPAKVLAVAGAAAVPSALAAATVRAATICAISSLSEAGVSPAVAGLTQGVLRMFWMRTAVLAAGVGVAVIGLVTVGTSVISGGPAVAADPPAKAAVSKPAAPKPDDDLKDLVPTYVEGTVRDGDGKPIAGAHVEKSGTIGYAATFGNEREFSGRAVTGADGAYKLGFKTKPGTTVVITALHAEADGYVAHTEQFSYDEVKTTPGAPGGWDFVLARGEVIAGRVAEADRGDRTPILVRGPSFSRTFHTNPDGTFRFWVPKGTYTVSAAVHVKSVPRDKALADTEYSHGLVVKRAATAEKVASGTEGLVLKTGEPK